MEKAEGNKEKGFFLRDPYGGTSRIFFYEFHENAEVGKDDVDLHLGLSLNGRFGVDPKILNPSSSVTDFVHPSDRKIKEIQFPIIKTSSLPIKNEEESRKREEIQFPIIKTSSLPMKAEEECRKREEIQSLNYVDEDDNNKWERMKKIEVVKEPDDVNVRCYSHGGACRKCLSSAGELLGSGSSGITEFQSQQLVQGPSGSTDVRPLFNGQSLERRSILSGKSGEETTEILRNLMLRLPFVSTRGGIPNGKKIEGYLYGYKMGQHLKIVCVCHGAFLTPAEFVKHAGGSDLENPLKHIDILFAPL